MGEFMAGGADPAHLLAIIGIPAEFRGAEVGAQPEPVKEVVGVDPALVRPDGVFRAALRLVVTGVVEKNHVYVAVVVPVVLGEIHSSVQLFAGLNESLAFLTVVSGVIL